MTGPAPSDAEDDLLAAEYVLGVLPHGERLALARRIEADPALAARVRFWDENLSPLAMALEPVAPPPSTFTAVEHRLFAGTTRQPGLWGSLAFWRGLSAGLAGALVIAGLVFLTPAVFGPPETGSFVAQLSGTGDVVRLAAFYDARNRTLRLNRIAGAPVANRDFELWLIEGGHAPISLGVLPAQSVTAFKLKPDVAASFASGAVLAVSDEPRGGSPTGQPTGAVLATGALSAI